MIAILKGVAIVLVTIFLFAVSTKVNAGTPQEFLDIWKNKELVHDGTCATDGKGKIVPSEKDVKSVRCLAVSDEPLVHYVAIVGANGQAERLIRLNPVTYEQTVVWRRGVEV